MTRKQLNDDRQHHLPPGVRWSVRPGCLHPTVENAPEPLTRFNQRCACGSKVMGLRCPDCDRVY